MSSSSAASVLIPLLCLGLASCDGSRDGGGRAGGGAVEPAETSAAPADAALRLGLDELRKELADNGRVVRERPAATAPAAVPDSVLAARVRARLFEDPELPAMAIAVAAADGKVTLTGNAGSIEGLRRALRAALTVPEVRGVIAELSTAADDGSGLTKGSAEETPAPPGK